jgi:hypothetical protein
MKFTSSRWNLAAAKSCCGKKADSSVISPLSLYQPFAVDTRATWPIEHDGAGGAELLLVLHKALGYATHIRDSVQAKPHCIRRTCIDILLRISDCGEWSHDRGYESNNARFTHSVSLQFGFEGTMVGMSKCSQMGTEAY